MLHLKQASWIFLGVGLLAFLAALGLFLAIRRLRRRYREGRDALQQLRNEALGANLTMQGTVGAVPGGPKVKVDGP